MHQQLRRVKGLCPLFVTFKNFFYFHGKNVAFTHGIFNISHHHQGITIKNLIAKEEFCREMQEVPAMRTIYKALMRF
jgi:hypothetical protein